MCVSMYMHMDFQTALKCYLKLKYIHMCTCEHSNFYVYVGVFNIERHGPTSPM